MTPGDLSDRASTQGIWTRLESSSQVPQREPETPPRRRKGKGKGKKKGRGRKGKGRKKKNKEVLALSPPPVSLENQVRGLRYLPSVL